MITFTHRFQLFMGMTTELYPNSHPYIFSEWNLTGQLLYITSYSASPRCIRFSYFSQGQSQLY